MKANKRLTPEYWAKKYPKLLDQNGKNRFLVGDVKVLKDGNSFIVRFTNTAIFPAERLFASKLIHNVQVAFKLWSLPNDSICRNYGGIGVEYVLTP